jgi:hypothetical protein
MSFRREEDGNGCSFMYDTGLAPYRDGQTKPRRAQLDDRCACMAGALVCMTKQYSIAFLQASP